MEIEEIKNIIIDLSKKIEKNPNDYNSYYNRAYYKGILKDLEGAIEDYTKAIEINSNDPEAYENRAIIKAELLDHKGALEDIKKSIEINPNNAQHYWNSSLFKATLRDFKGASADYKKASQLEPAYKSTPYPFKLIGLDDDINLDEMNLGEKEINEELEDSKFQEYGVANLQEIIKNEWSEELDHIRLGITRRVDHFESNEESNQGIEYTSIEYSLKIKLYYEGDDEYEDDYETPGLVIVDVMLNDSNGAILSSSEREGLVFCDPKSEETYFFDEFEELFNSDVKYFGDHLIAEFNNAINDFGKAWGNPSDDQNDKIELEKLFDFKKILIRLQEYQAKKKV